SGLAGGPRAGGDRQGTAPAGGWAFVNGARLQAPSVTLNGLDVEAGVPDTGARDASNHSNRRVEPVMLPNEDDRYTEPVSRSPGSTGMYLPGSNVTRGFGSVQSPTNTDRPRQ